MRKVVDSSEVAHLWANQAQEEARNANSSCSFFGATLYSYREPIGRLIKVKGKTVALFRNRSFSITTSRHQSRMRQATSQFDSFTVPELGAGNSWTTPRRFADVHKLNLSSYATRIIDAAKAASRARSNTECKLSALAELVAAANFYATTFGYKARFKVSSDIDLAELKLKAAAEEKRDAARRVKADRERAAQQAALEKEFREVLLPAWLRGDAIRLPYVRGESFARIEDEELVTSTGARVPIDHVKRALPVVLRIIERGEAWQSNGSTIHIGHYSLDRIEPDGTVIVGCHQFKAEEVTRIAAMLA